MHMVTQDLCLFFTKMMTNVYGFHGDAVPNMTQMDSRYQASREDQLYLKADL